MSTGGLGESFLGVILGKVSREPSLCNSPLEPTNLVWTHVKFPSYVRYPAFGLVGQPNRLSF